MKSLLRSIGAPLAGYVAILIGAIVFQDLLFGGVTHHSPLVDLLVGGGMTTVAAVFGGYILAAIAPARPFLHATPLLIWLCTETTLLHLENQSPLWFDIFAGGSVIVGILLGMFVWTKREAAARNKPKTSTFGSESIP